MPEREPVAAVSRRITVTFTPKALGAVDRLVGQTGGTKADVVNYGVQLYDFVETEKAKGKKLALIDEAGHVEAVTLL